MELVLLTVQQLAVMLIYLLAGYALVRFGVISPQGSRDLAGMLVKLIIPAILVNSFCAPFSVRRLADLTQGFALAALLLGLAIAAARLLFPRAPLENFSAAFSNAGFMGIPLVSAVLGSDAVLYIVPFVALLNILQWTYGVDVICERHTKITPRGILWNPPVAAVGIGLVLFLTGAGGALPAVADTALKGVCALNTPLAMMILGVYLAREKPSSLFTDPGLYGVCAARLALVPLLSLAVLWLLPVRREVALAVLIAASAPVGANVAVYAQLHGRDHARASKIVVLSTLLSLVSLPLVTALAQVIL